MRPTNERVFLYYCDSKALCGQRYATEYRAGNLEALIWGT